MAQEEGPLYLSWDINTTGRRLIDEICHIAVHDACSTFEQYVMPYRDIDYSSRKRYLLKTVNIGVYRVLRETVGGKILKTKSEISALTDFVNWLEERKTVEGRDVIIMYYETYTPAPFILIESLKKYNLLPRFKETVKGFANSFNYIKSKCEKIMLTYSIKNLAKILLNKEYNNHNACERARILYEIVAHLSVGESQDGEEDISAALQSYVSTVEEIEEGIAALKVTLNKQNSLKPIFGPFIRMDKKRRQALILRRHLTSSDIDYEMLKAVWTRNEDLKVFLKNNLKGEISDEDLTDLDFMIAKHMGATGPGGGQSDKNKSSVLGLGKNSLKKNVSRQNFRGNQRKPNKKFGDNSKTGKINSANSNLTSTTASTKSNNKSNGDENIKVESQSEICADDDSATAAIVPERSDSCRSPNIVDHKKEP